MRTRDEVLREFSLHTIDPNSEESQQVFAMADRIRELEERVEELSLNRMADEDAKELGEFLSQFDLQGIPAPVAASEPVAWKETLIKLRLCAGSHVPSARLLGNITAEEILVLCDHFIAHPSAAGVAVTEAMVRAACEEFTRQYGRDERLDADVAKAVLTAALTAASEGASA